jgi:outer membrane protein OmpA-like peptidoglycan-associated protein
VSGVSSIHLAAAGFVMMLQVSLPLLASGQTTIPLCPGLTMVGAVNEPYGDYEPITTIESVGPDAVSLNYSTEVRTGTSIRNVNVARRVLVRDLRSARLVMQWFSPNAPRTFPGATAFGPSSAVLHALKTKGVAELALVDRENSAMPADSAVHPNVFDYEMVYRLRTVGTAPVLVPIIVNGAKVSLPAIRVQGDYMDDHAEWLFLDDESSPVGLQFSLRSGGSAGPVMTSRLVKISFDCDPSKAPAASPLEQSLLETGRADVYHIYFAFNSDRIRGQSEPTLKEIAQVLRRHPDWKLAIEGHTDSIGGASYNLDLSQRRAASVKVALVGRYGIDGERLATGGAGASQPKEGNATLEGRARNRRVELVRQ